MIVTGLGLPKNADHCAGSPRQPPTGKGKTVRHTLAASRRVVFLTVLSVAWIAAVDSQLFAQGGPAKTPATPPARPSPKIPGPGVPVRRQPLAGIVVDPAGAPVPGCKVWMVGVNSTERTAEAIDQTVTDPQSRFAFAAEKLKAPHAPRDRVAFFARDAKGRIGWPIRQQVPTRANDVEELRVQLFDVQDYRGRLTETSGQPIAKAEVRPLYATTADINAGISDFGWFPPELLAKIGGETIASTRRSRAMRSRFSGRRMPFPAWPACWRFRRPNGSDTSPILSPSSSPERRTNADAVPGSGSVQPLRVQPGRYWRRNRSLASGLLVTRPAAPS
jgi:hypothetical protein